jgi:EmrB/QacA subfamily drug resistance transporter
VSVIESSTAMSEPTGSAAPATAAATTPGARPAFTPYPARWRALPVILIAMFMAMFDYFVVNVAASSLQHDLHAGNSALELIVGGYGFAYASGLITGGRLGDLHGHRRLFVLGMSLFAISSLLCGIAPNGWALVAFRILQGGTAALMVPQVLALINTMFPPEERAKAMSAFGATIGLGSVAGQVLGGVLLDANLFGWGWRSIFFINVPIGLVAVILAVRWLPKHEPTHRPKLDPVGALGISLALALILVPITLGQPEGWPVWTFVAMAASVPVLFGTLRYEHRLHLRDGQPVLDLQMVRERVFAAGMVISGGYLAFFAGFMLCLTLLLQDGLGLSPLRAGLAFAPLGIAFGLSSFLLARRIAARIGNRVIVLGAVLSLLGLATTLGVLLAKGSDVTALELVPGGVLIGLGNGMAIPSMIGAVLSSGIEPHKAGMAAGVLTTAQQFGNAVGATVLGTIFFSVLGSGIHVSNFVTAMETSTVVGLAIVVLVLASAFLLPKKVSRA